MRKLILSSLFIAMSGLCFGQTSTLRALQKKYPEGKSFYLYQSTLRALLSGSGTEFNSLANGVDKLTVVQIDKKQIQIPKGEFGMLSQALAEEGFEEMMAMSGPQSRFGWYSEKGTDSKHVVGMVDDADQLFLFDLIGTVDVSMLYRLQASDLTNFSKLFDTMNFTK